MIETTAERALKKVIIIGSGGHAKVLADIVLGQKDRYELLGFVDSDGAKWGAEIFGSPVLGGDERVFGDSPSSFFLINGIGSTGETRKRAAIFECFKSKGFIFCNVISDFSYLSEQTAYGEGLQLISGGVIHPGCRLGSNVLVNTGASIDHDCVIGDNAHIAPGATLSGGVSVGEGAHIGSGATVIQGVSIGAGALVAAGAVVVSDVERNATVAGVPAKSISTYDKMTDKNDR